MKLFKNLMFMVALVPFGCKGADAGLSTKADVSMRRTRCFFPVLYIVQKRQPHAFRQERFAGEVDPAIQRATDEWKLRRFDKLENDLIRAGVDPKMAHDMAAERREDERAREAQEIAQASRADEGAEEAQRLRVARFKNRLKPVTIVKEDPWFTAQRNAQARREAQERFDRGQFTISSESEQELVDSPTSEEDAAKIEQLLQDFTRADMAGTIPNSMYEELQKSRLMDDQRRVLDYDKLGNYLLQKKNMSNGRIVHKISAVCKGAEECAQQPGVVIGPKILAHYFGQFVACDTNKLYDAAFAYYTAKRDQGAAAKAQELVFLRQDMGPRAFSYIGELVEFGRDDVLAFKAEHENDAYMSGQIESAIKMQNALCDPESDVREILRIYHKQHAPVQN